MKPFLGNSGRAFWTNARSICVISLLVLLDLSKAFDNENHDLLLNKLVQLKIDSTWFASYWHHRTHSVKIDTIMSKAKSNLYEAPQGWVLGPIPFNIFINDIPKMNSFTTTLLNFCSHYPWQNSGPWVGHGDTTDESLLLSMAFRQDRPPYSLEIFQWRPADNDQYSNSEILKATDAHKPPHITYYNSLVGSL